MHYVPNLDLRSLMFVDQMPNTECLEGSQYFGYVESMQNHEI